MRSLRSVGNVSGSDIDTLDITDAHAVSTYFEDHPADVIVHLAALKGNLESRLRPVDFFQVNTVGVLNLLEACRKLSIRKFVFMSSVTVHGRSDTAVDEASPIRPLHPYGASKAAGEALVESYAFSYGIQAVILRPNFIVGPIPAPRPYRDNFIYDFVQAAHAKGVIHLAGDGHHEREWLHPDDVANAVRAAASRDNESCETFLLSGNRLRMLDLVNKIATLVGNTQIVTDPSAHWVFSLISSNDHARRRLGWQPERDIDSIIGEIWDEYRSRLER